MVLTPLTLAAELFPRGVTHYFVGGLLVGLGVAVVYLATAIPVGNSTFLETTLSYVSDLPRFNTRKYLKSRDWRVVFAASMVAGAALYGFLVTPGAWVTDVQWWRLLGGGFLVGIGTRLGKGCTMGHGVCGIGSGARVSVVNVATFVGVAVGTALVVEALGVMP